MTESGRDAAPGQAIQLRYLDSVPNAFPESPVILLIHGSPLAASRVFRTHAAELAAAGRVLAPDLPGFSHSTLKIAAYGFKAHADYLRQFMDRLGLRRVHVAAHSMGGGVALHLAKTVPARVASLTLISAVGVQERELLGDYYLNRGLHAVQLLALSVLQEDTPPHGAFRSPAPEPFLRPQFF